MNRHSLRKLRLKINGALLTPAVTKTVTPAVDTSSQVDMGVDTPQFAADYSSIYLTLCHTLHVILEFLNIPIPKQLCRINK